MSPEPHNSVEVFYSYAHEDEKLRDELKKHLSNLKRQGVITDWYDRDISAGNEWDDEIKQHLDSARVILLLISADFMDSDYIHDVEVKRAMERHESGEARVIPVILRPVDWQGAPFSKLQGLPTDAKPITSWDDRDEAFLDITKSIRKAIQEVSGPTASVPTVPDIPRPPKVGFVSRRGKDGRDIVELLRVELAPEKNQLVALWGAGGVGKTTLAAESVRALAEAYEQRIIWVTAEARPNFAFSTLLDDIAEQLGRSDLRSLAVGPKEEAVRPLIGAKPTLIVLDNLETIAPEEEWKCKDFLAKRVHCPALITTRERIDDAYLVPLAAMAPDEAKELLKRLIFQSPDPDIYEVVEAGRILQTAEYNPLIIQWIVAQIDLAQDPEEVLTDLSRGEGDAAQRVFKRSYNLPQLNDGGRAVLLALALFTPSAGRPTLAAVAGMDLGKKREKERFKKAQETLASLWLIQKMDGGLRLAIAGLTRELTKAQLATDLRTKTFSQRFVSRFLSFAETHAKPTREDYNILELEKDNLLSATDLAFGHGDWASVLGLAYVLAVPTPGGMLSVRGYWEDALRVAGLALKIARSLKQEIQIADWSHILAIMYQDRGELDEARQLYDESLKIRTKLDDQSGIAVTLHQLGWLSQEEGDFAGARLLYNESLTIKKRLGDQLRIASTLHQLGWLAQEEGDFAEARRLYNESLGITSSLGQETSIANTLHQLGWLAQDEGDFAEARRLYNQSLEISKKVGDRGGIAYGLHQLGTLHFVEKDYEVAEKLLQESLAILRKLGNRQNCAECLESIGKLRIAQQQLPAAESLFIEALGIAKTLGIQFRIGSVKYSLGLLAEKQGDRGRAAELIREALPMFEKLYSPKAKAARRDLERLDAKQAESNR